MAEIALVDVLAGLPDRRRKQGTRNSLQLCLALFTLAVAAGNQGFLAIGGWLKLYKQQLNYLLETDNTQMFCQEERLKLQSDHPSYLCSE